ncbi:MAG: ATP-binding cassette domain-containing protein [Planctomycetota bacterium]|nr:ATP-binding cassette domain-containing protein [Planctomycetota bacterium]
MTATDVMATDPLLEFREVSYEAGGRRILDHLNWTLEAGQHWALLGPNGSGKTTLLRLATGYLWPNAGGAIWRCGERCLDLRKLRTSIGWVASHLLAAVPPSEVVTDTVLSGRFAEWGLRPFSRPLLSAHDRERADEELRRLGAESLASRPFGVLSQGEQQKILIARARMADPLLILLDEPCAGLDPGGRERFLADLEVWLSESTAPRVVFITHHVEEILPAMTHTLVLSQGRVARCGRSEEVIDTALLADIFRAPPCRIELSGGRRWPIWGPDSEP